MATASLGLSLNQTLQIEVLACIFEIQLTILQPLPEFITMPIYCVLSFHSSKMSSYAFRAHTLGVCFLHYT